MRLLLGSGGFSTPERRDGWKSEMNSYLGSIKRVLFIPYALADHDSYVQALKTWGFHGDREVIGIHTVKDPKKAVREAECISVGGGNTFRLLHDLYTNDLVEVVRERVFAGLPYVGVSAGTNVAGPTMKTTNDMPITYPPSLDAFNLVPFQINPHYFAGAIHIKEEQGYVQYGGETRDDRIREFHEMNNTPVIGLWEGSILRIENRRLKLAGHNPRARLFRKGENVRDFAGPEDLTPFLNLHPH
ncbi:MAG TPA: dipeptidase PepE [Bdellovibrionales bacterium]|nr:dipeptidase PepE [Bdellovibrionales bacterium]